MGPNRLTIQIGGIRYPIRTFEEADYVHELAQEIDDTVRELMATGTASLNEALILISLSYLDAYKKAEASCDNLRDQVSQYLEDVNAARSELSASKREVERLKKNAKKGTANEETSGNTGARRQS